MTMKKKVLTSLISMIIIITIIIIIYENQQEFVTLHSTEVVVFDNDKLKVTKVGTIDKLTPLFVKDHVIYAFEDHYLYKSSDDGFTFEQLGKLPKIKPSFINIISNYVARLRITRNFRRNRGPWILTVLNSGTIIVIYDHIYRSVDNGKTFKAISFPTEDFAKPFTNEIAVTPSGNIYIGEYATQKRPHEVRILKGSNDGQDWSVAYTFPSGTVFHIHSIFWSKLRNSLLVATGDRPEENHLFETKDEFKSLNVIGKGDQGWRLVSPSETNEFVFWGSDNDQTGSYIYTLKGTQRQKFNFMGKVSYDSTKLSSNTLAISETLEPVSPYTTSSNTTFEIGVWLSNNGKEWLKALNFELTNQTQLIQTRKRPRLLFPTGDGSARNLLLSPKWVNSPESCNEPCILMYRIEWKNEEEPAPET